LHPQASRVTAEAQPIEGGEGVGEYQADAVFASTQAQVNVDIGTPDFREVRDSAASESPLTNKDDTEEDESNT
jgi:hypothetical protein